MKEEVWKDIPEYEGLYQVSNLGRIKSLSRIIKRSNGIGVLPLKERCIKLSISKRSGYVFGMIFKKGKPKNIKTSILVAMAFLGHRPDGTQKIVVDHIDHNKLNNNLSNLRLISQRENSNKKHLKSSSKYVGVSFCKAIKKWDSRVTIDGNQKYLGSFKNEIDAHNAYQRAIK